MKLNEVFDQPTEEVPAVRRVKAAQKLAMSKKLGGRKWQIKFKELNPENALNRIKHAVSRGRPVDEQDLKIIENDPHTASEYATNVLRDRWPRGEHSFVNIPKLSVPYAKWTIRQRWPEAEPAIIKDPIYATGYAIQFFKDRWPEAEPAIMSHAPGAATYAMHHNFRLPPDLEKQVFNSWRRDSYKRKFNIP